VFFCLALVLAKPIAAKPSKIVAGHDADKTNELLQALAEAINKKVDRSVL
jgi:TRAF3-interacting protein 1